MTHMLRREGHAAGHKRVYRLMHLRGYRLFIRSPDPAWARGQLFGILTY